MVRTKLDYKAVELTASSSTKKRHWCRASLPVEIRSSRRPGVPTTTSTWRKHWPKSGTLVLEIYQDIRICVNVNHFTHISPWRIKVHLLMIYYDFFQKIDTQWITKHMTTSTWNKGWTYLLDWENQIFCNKLNYFA